jgi:hypothetical protein
MINRAKIGIETAKRSELQQTYKDKHCSPEWRI